MHVRSATPDNLDGLVGILDSAALQTDQDRIRRSIAAGETVVAVEDGRLLGAAVAIPTGPKGETGVRIDAIAVRKRRQGQGIGTALVEAITDRHDTVVAEFDRPVRPFYESLGFQIEPVEDEPDRFRGQYQRE